MITFVVNGTEFAGDIAEAVTLSPAVQDHLTVDACSRRFIISDARIDPSAFLSLQSLFSSSSTATANSHLPSLVLLSQQLLNPSLEQHFFSVLHSPDFTRLSLDAADDLLSRECFPTSSEDDFLRKLWHSGPSPFLFSIMSHSPA
jgi:hypothetical protein